MNHGWLQGLWILGSHQPHSACQYIHFSGDVVLDSQKVQNPFKPLQSLKIIGWIIAKPSCSSKVLKKARAWFLLESNLNGSRTLLGFRKPQARAPSTPPAPSPTKQAQLCNILHFVQTRLDFPRQYDFTCFNVVCYKNGWRLLHGTLGFTNENDELMLVVCAAHPLASAD